MLALAGERPSQPKNRVILGLSEDVWTLIEKCWDSIPSARPHAADILVLLETGSRDWVSPGPEAVANLSLGRATCKNPPTAKSADTMSDAVFGTIGGGAIHPQEARQSPPTSNEEGIRSETVKDTFLLAFLPCLRHSRNISPTS